MHQSIRETSAGVRMMTCEPFRILPHSSKRMMRHTWNELVV